tara:strand:- start:731 stop:928 length:198 start_codon:yes stop_codon:yes gene_type:complete
MDQDELSFDECSQKLIHFESEAKNYLRDKGIEYDHTQDLDWDLRWIDVHGVKIPLVLNQEKDSET